MKTNNNRGEEKIAVFWKGEVSQLDLCTAGHDLGQWCAKAPRGEVRGAGGNAIAMANRAGLECQPRAWGPSALLGLLLLGNHSTVHMGWGLFHVPQLQLSVENKGFCS